MNIIKEKPITVRVWRMCAGEHLACVQQKKNVLNHSLHKLILYI